MRIVEHARGNTRQPVALRLSCCLSHLTLPHIAMSTNASCCSLSAACHAPLPLSPGLLRDMPTEVLRLHLSILRASSPPDNALRWFNIFTPTFAQHDMTRAPSARNSDPSGPKSSGSDSDSPLPRTPRPRRARRTATVTPKQTPVGPHHRRLPRTSRPASLPGHVPGHNATLASNAAPSPPQLPPSIAALPRPDTAATSTPYVHLQAALGTAATPLRQGTATSRHHRDRYSRHASPDSSGDRRHSATSTHCWDGYMHRTPPGSPGGAHMRGRQHSPSSSRSSSCSPSAADLHHHEATTFTPQPAPAVLSGSHSCHLPPGPPPPPPPTQGTPHATPQAPTRATFSATGREICHCYNYGQCTRGN